MICLRIGGAFANEDSWRFLRSMGHVLLFFSHWRMHLRQNMWPDGHCTGSMNTPSQMMHIRYPNSGLLHDEYLSGSFMAEIKISKNGIKSESNSWENCAVRTARSDVFAYSRSTIPSCPESSFSSCALLGAQTSNPLPSFLHSRMYTLSELTFDPWSHCSWCSVNMAFCYSCVLFFWSKRERERKRERGKREREDLKTVPFPFARSPISESYTVTWSWLQLPQLILVTSDRNAFYFCALLQILT